MATCLHCKGPCRLTDGKEIYPHRSDLYSKPIWKCDPCAATVGCHPGTKTPLGYAANAETRKARMLLHNSMMDPIWKGADKQRRMRSKVYAFLSEKMGITADKTHTGMFTIEQCREAWKALKGQTPETIQQWADRAHGETND